MADLASDSSLVRISKRNIAKAFTRKLERRAQPRLNGSRRRIRCRAPDQLCTPVCCRNCEIDRQATQMMAREATRLTAVFVTALGLAGCGESAKLPANADFGASPQLPAPSTTAIPTVNIAHAVGWPEGLAPKAAEGAKVVAFARALD